MRVLVTGDRGFIGKPIKDKFENEGNEVYGWDIDGVTMKDKVIYRESLLEYNAVSNVISNISPDVIIHCAGGADVTFSVKYPHKDLESNYVITHNILFAIKEHNMTNVRVIFLSSAAVYGNPKSLPIDENYDINPLSPYALHKRSSEEICEFLVKHYDMDIKVLRVFSAYGPGLRKQIFWDMYQKTEQSYEIEMFGTGSESRDYIYIDDLIQAIYLVTMKAEKKDFLYNVANGKEVTIREVTELFLKQIGRPADAAKFIGKPREGEPINWCADIGKLRQLGYRQTVNLSEGIGRYVKWVENINDI